MFRKAVDEAAAEVGRVQRIAPVASKQNRVHSHGNEGYGNDSGQDVVNRNGLDKLSIHSEAQAG